MTEEQAERLLGVLASIANALDDIANTLERAEKNR